MRLELRRRKHHPAPVGFKRVRQWQVLEEIAALDFIGLERGESIQCHSLRQSDGGADRDGLAAGHARNRIGRAMGEDQFGFDKAAHRETDEIEQRHQFAGSDLGKFLRGAGTPGG